MPNSDHPIEAGRRNFLKGSAALAGLPAVGSILSGLLLTPNRSEAALTPQCEDGVPTRSQPPGPFYTPNTPLRENLREPDMQGKEMRLSGYILNQFCEPVSDAILDFWHADSDGRYDNLGYRLRGHLFSDQSGRYQLDTIIPGLYPGRTRHIHVITQGRSTGALTTQLYFPNEPENQRDFGYQRRLELTPAQNGEYHFSFILHEQT